MAGEPHPVGAFSSLFRFGFPRERSTPWESIVRITAARRNLWICETPRSTKHESSHDRPREPRDFPIAAHFDERSFGMAIGKAPQFGSFRNAIVKILPFNEISAGAAWRGQTGKTGRKELSANMNRRRRCEWRRAFTRYLLPSARFQRRLATDRENGWCVSGKKTSSSGGVRTISLTKPS